MSLARAHHCPVSARQWKGSQAHSRDTEPFDRKNKQDGAEHLAGRFAALPASVSRRAVWVDLGAKAELLPSSDTPRTLTLLLKQAAWIQLCRVVQAAELRESAIHSSQDRSAKHGDREATYTI